MHLMTAPETPIFQLFERLTGREDRMSLDQWLTFCAQEQGETQDDERMRACFHEVRMDIM